MDVGSHLHANPASLPKREAADGMRKRGFPSVARCSLPRSCVTPGLAALLIGFSACGPSDADGAAGQRPARVILVSMDTVRADVLDDLEGLGASELPNLAALARDGARFRRFYAASTYTIPSHMSIFTGLDPGAHGIVSEERELLPDVATLATRLRDAGYRTRAFHEGSYVGERYGFARGFDEYEEIERVSLVTSELPRVLDWMEGQADEPYFLFLHTYAAHNPYGGYEDYRARSPERGLPAADELVALDRGASAGERELSEREFLDLTIYNQLCEVRSERVDSVRKTLAPEYVRTRFFAEDIAAVRRAYRDRITVIDRALGRLRAELEARGQWEDTLLVVTSDHGEAFFEHGVSWHGYVPFDEVLRVPLFVSYPRLFEAAGAPTPVEVDGLAWHLDLFPTLLSMAGLTPEPGLSGLDLTDAILGRSTLPEDRGLFPLVLEVPTRKPRPERRAALVGGHKWIEGHPRFGAAEGLLFDLEVDPEERANRLGEPGELGELVPSLRAALERYESSLVPRSRERTAPLPELDATELEALEALGYAEAGSSE